MKSWFRLELNLVHLALFEQSDLQVVGGTGWLSRFDGLLRAFTVLIINMLLEVCQSHDISIFLN